MGKFKIFAFTFPASGHFNPMIPILEEIKKTHDVEIIFYIHESYRKKVESYNIQFRSLKNLDLEALTRSEMSEEKKEMNFFKLIRFMIDSADSNLEYLANEIEREAPDLIIYDPFMLHLRFLKRFYDKYYQLNQKSSASSSLKFRPKRPFPPCILMHTSFVIDNAIYPNKFEKSMSSLPEFKFSYIFELIFLLIHILKICLKYRLNLFPDCNMFDFSLKKHDVMMFSPVFPELHPRSHMYDDKLIKFIGSTSINFSNLNFIVQSSNDAVSKVLSEFPIRDGSAATKFNSSLKLVYVSLGTVVNFNTKVYLKILDALKTFDDELANFRGDRKVNFSDLRIIVSVGEGNQKFIDSHRFPDNIILVKSAPQVEILQRAHLFVTHSGMNSTSEAIHYGVPMLCTPIFADQPLVAYRVCDELGLGIRLNSKDLKVEEIRRAAFKILCTRSFYERAARYSNISHEYYGRVIGANLVIQYLNDQEKRNQ